MLRIRSRLAWLAAGVGLLAAGCGGGPAQHAPVAVKAPPKPVYTTRPVHHGVFLAHFAPTQSQTLTGNVGTWNGSPAPTFTEQWQRCDAQAANCVNIPGATTLTYSVQAADVGSTLRIVVTATNTKGSASVASVATGVVTGSSGTLLFNQGFETSPYTTPGTPGGLYQGIQAGNWSGQSNGAKHYFGDAYVDNGTSTPLTTQGSIFNLAGFGNVPAGDGNNSWRTVTPVPPSGTCPGCPTGQGYNLESTAANSPPVTLAANDLGQTKYYGLMFYLPAGDNINSSQPFGSIFYQVHWTNADPPGVGMALHTQGGSAVNGTADSVVLALETGACNNSLGTDTYPNGSPAPPGCQYRSNADAPQCNIAPDPNLGTIHCLPGAFIIPPGQLQYGVWEEVILGVDWESTATGSFHTWYKTKAESTWHTGDSVTGLPTMQWDEKYGLTCPSPPTTTMACGYPANEHLDVYLGLQSAPFQMSFDDQVIGTSLSAVQNALPSASSPPPAPPTNTALPAASGTTVQGQVLSTTDGTWAGNPAPTFTYQWRRCDSSGANCSNISGATSSTYTLVAADVGGTVRSVVTGTNTQGSASATSVATGVVTSSGGGSPVVGTGPSLAECRVGGVSSGSLTNCTPATSGSSGYTNATAISAPAINGVFPGCATTTSTTCHIYINVPTNLVTNNSNKPVPLVINFPDGCTGGDSATPKVGSCFDGTGTLAAYTWGQECAIAKCITVAMFPNLPGGYYTPYIYGNTTADQGVEIHAIIAYMESHYAIDPNMIFTAGGSKGGSMAYDTACDPTFHGAGGDHIAGVSAGSTSFPTSSTSFSSQNLGVHAGGCPALLASATGAEPDPPATTHPFMMQTWYAPRDQGNAVCSPVNGIDGVPTTVDNCRNGGGIGNNTAHTAPGAYIQDGLQVDGYAAAPYDGCAATAVGTPSPVTTTERWTGTAWAAGSSTTTVNARTWTGCGTAAFPYSGGGSTTAAVQSVDFLAAACHEYACNNVDGLPLFADLSWQFWTTGTSAP